ncbi:MAG TPA: glycosyltransferase [Usitatibacter sp.]|nr:glycosyltransferase [Usitatibacter sp.]
MKIFLAATSLASAYGGPARSVARLAESLADEDDVGLWSADGSRPSPASGRLRWLPGALDSAFGAFGTPDVIHDNGIWLPHNHCLAVRARSLSIARVVSTRGMLEPWARSHKAIRKALAWAGYQRRDLARAGCLHATASSEAANLLKLGLNVDIRTIPNGVDVPPPMGATASQRVRRQRIALFLGRICPIKGLEMLVRAWSIARPAGWILRIAGPDEAGHRAVVEHEVAAAGLAQAVEFIGTVDDSFKTRVFHSADILVLPSYSESFGMSAAEALAHGVPVLATRGTPWSSLIEHSCGWWVDTTEQGLSEGLREVAATSAEELLAMGSRGRDYVASELGWSSVARRFRQLYAELMT